MKRSDSFSISTYNNLAEDLCKQNRWKEALKTYKTAYELQKAKFIGDLLIARTLNDIGVVYTNMGPEYYIQALSSFREALQIQLKHQKKTADSATLKTRQKEVKITTRNMKILMEEMK